MDLRYEISSYRHNLNPGGSVWRLFIATTWKNSNLKSITEIAAALRAENSREGKIMMNWGSLIAIALTVLQIVKENIDD